MSSSLSVAEKRAAKNFYKQRADYYEDMASLLTTTNRKMLSIFEADAQRFAGTPRGVLSTLWAQRFIDNGADLAMAWQDSLPDAEIAILQVQQQAGSDAVPSALRDLAVMARLVDRMRAAVTTTLGVGLLALGLAVGALTILPGYAIDAVKQAMDIPVAYWGPMGKAMLAWDRTVKTYALPFAFCLSLALTWLVWSFNNWVGPLRNVADRTIVLYTMQRDVAAVRFLMTLSTLTQRRGNVMHTLEDALLSLTESQVSVWLRWRIEQILERISDTGATTCEVFDVGLLSRDIFWRLRDVEEGRGFATAFQVTSEYVAADLVPRLINNLSRWRWILLLLGVVCTGGMAFWVQAVSFEMKGAAMNYMQ
jgi:hypothetical protein